MKKLLLICLSTLILSSCDMSGLNVTELPPTKAPLNLQDPAPLQLDKVVWVVNVSSTGTYYSLDALNYSNLSKDLDKTQDQMLLFHQQKLECQSYYESK